MMNLLKFGEKNKGVKNTYGAVTENSNIQIVSDTDVAKKQIAMYQDIKDYIESVVDEDGIVRNVVTANKVRLQNYIIQFDSTNKYIHVKDKATGFVYGTYSLGNKKLASGDNVQFIIFNILQRISCPNASKGCKKFCYANKTNTNVTCKNSSSRNSRVNNLIMTMFENFADITNEVINFVKEYTKRKIIFRFHEAGDIYCKEYWAKIKNVMESNQDVNFMYYTKTVFVLDEINEINNAHNVALRYSLDDTTNQAIIDKCDKLNCLTFIVVDNKSTCQAMEVVGNNNMCNVKNVEVTEKLQQLEKLNNDLKAETRKSYQNKIMVEINKINKSVIDDNKTCTNCMKCFNKNKVALFVATH